MTTSSDRTGTGVELGGSTAGMSTAHGVLEVRAALADLQARQGEGLRAALEAGIATLEEAEREWLDAGSPEGGQGGPGRRDDLARRMFMEHHEAAARNYGYSGAYPSMEEGINATRALWSGHFYRRADEPGPDGDLARAAIQRLWNGVRPAWDRLLASPGLSVESGLVHPDSLAQLREEEARTKARLAAGQLPHLQDLWLFAVSPEDQARTAEAAALILWPQVRDAWRTEHAAELAVQLTLSKEDNGAYKGDRLAEDALRLAVEGQLRAFREEPSAAPFTWRAGDDGSGAISSASAGPGMCWWDACLAAVLDRIGTNGSPLRQAGERLAEDTRTAARERWGEWLGTVPALPGTVRTEDPWRRWRSLLYAGQVLARVLWRGEIRDRLERDAKNPPALALTVVGGMARAFYEKDRQVLMFPPPSGTGSAVIVGADGEELARTAVLPASELEDLQRGALKLRGYMGHLAIRGFAVRGWEQTRAGTANPSILGFDGGLAGCAHELGARSKKAADELRDILEAGQAFRREWASGEVGGLWTYANQRQAPGRRAFLEVRLGRPLTPYMVHGLGPRERILVPLPPMPPTVGAERTWAPQAAFQLALVRGMVERRTELVREGGARFTGAELARMARAVGLSPELIPRVLDRWTQDGTDGLACLERVGRDRYHLPDNADYRAARAFLEDGGQRSLRKAAAGRASVKARLAPRRKPKNTPGE